MNKIIIKENLDLLSSNFDRLKKYFSIKNSINSRISPKKFEFKYIDEIKNNKILNIVTIDLELNNLKFEVSTEKDINEFELESHLNSNCNDLLTELLFGTSKYTVRIYLQYTNYKPLDESVIFNFENTIKIYGYKMPKNGGFYADDNMISCPREQILFSDIEVSAYDILSARTIAFNKILEFSSFLAVLIDVGIGPFCSKCFPALNIVNRQGIGYGDCDKGFYDEELDLIVYDNLNGLIAIDEDGKMVFNENFSLSVPGSDINTSICNYNKYLDNIFKDHEIIKSKNKLNRGTIKKDIHYYNNNIHMVNEHISFFRKLKNYKDENKDCNYKFLYNAAKLYNKSLLIFQNEPTMMISYLVASIETLSKTEKSADYYKQISNDMNKFIAFCKKYSDENEYNESLLRYLYGDIRSSHFHSGEFKLFEYECELNPYLDSNFFESRQKIYLEGHTYLRSIFINWINKNILVK